MIDGVNPPPPPHAPKVFNFKERCRLGVAVSEEEVDIGSVADVMAATYGNNLQPALDACWKMVYHMFPSTSYDKVADGFMLGIGDGNKGECYAQFGLSDRVLHYPQEGDWMTCRPSLTSHDSVIPTLYDKPDPPPPPNPPKSPPPSPPPPPLPR